MPDTIRTLADLNLRFADNTAGVIAPQDLRDLVVSTMPYAEIGSGAKTAVTLGTGFQPLAFDAAGAWTFGFTVDATNRWVAGTPCDMRAEVTLEVQFTGAVGQSYQFAVFRNPDGTPVQLAGLSLTEVVVAATQRGAVNVSAAVALAAGDKLQAGVRCDGQAFTLLRGGLRVKRIGCA
jgi:hypothetical protein